MKSFVRKRKCTLSHVVHEVSEKPFSPMWPSLAIRCSLLTVSRDFRREKSSELLGLQAARLTGRFVHV